MPAIHHASAWDKHPIAVQIESRDPEAKVRELLRVWQERCPIYLALVKPQTVNVRLSVSAQRVGL